MSVLVQVAASRCVPGRKTTLDAISRRLNWARALKKGDLRSLAGKLAGRFNIRTQQWDLVQFRVSVSAK